MNYKQCIINIRERQGDIQDLKPKNTGQLTENALLKDQNNALKTPLYACLPTQEKVLPINQNLRIYPLQEVVKTVERKSSSCRN